MTNFKELSSLDETIFVKIGHITRQLHDALEELGHTPKLQGSVKELPNVRSRLDYIAHLTGDAAEKVLNLVDTLKGNQAQIADRARKLDQALSQMPELVARHPALREWVHEIGRNSAVSDDQLTEVMLAQNFHDLTGQSIQRVVKIAAIIEEQLMELLVNAARPVDAPLEDASALAGPAFHGHGRSDVMSNQSQVDSMLAKLGF